MIKRTMQAVRSPSLVVSRMNFTSNFPRNRPIKNAPEAPMAPACVGLNQPRKSPPMARTNRITASMIPLKERTFVPQLVGRPGGARFGLRMHKRRTVATKKMLKIIPGTIPAIKSSPMDCSVRIPYTIRTVLGGIRIPSVPAAATVPVARISS